MFNLFDSYALQARLYPALLALFPALATVLAWFPALLTSSVGAAILTVINACGLLFLLAELSRSQGKRVQSQLLKDWETLPTTRFLRHRDTTLPAGVKARYHTYLASHAGLGALPSADEERADPGAADAQYDSAILWLKEQCRGEGFDLLLGENTSYGFRRNFLGLKPAGLVVAVNSVLWPVVVLWLLRYPREDGLSWSALTQTVRYLEAVHVGALGISILSAITWLVVIRDDWVKEAAEQYGIRLLAACDKLAVRP